MGSGRSGLYSGAVPNFDIPYSKQSRPISSFKVSDLNQSNDSEGSFSDYKKDINTDKQNKHIPGTKNYEPGKSKLSVSISEAQELVNQFSGKGEKVSNNKERVDFEKVIGKYVDPTTGQESDTTVGMIHYSKTGTHIVPAKPKGE